MTIALSLSGWRGDIYPGKIIRGKINNQGFDGFLQALYNGMMDSFSRCLRRDDTPTEDILWRSLRSRRLNGLKFRRQHPIGAYIVDFYCHEKNLVVEIDGDSHYLPGAQEKDIIRQSFIEQRGFR